MKRSEKAFAIEDLAARAKSAKTLVLVDYRGLTVPQISQLRSSVKAAGGELMVVKNSLLKLALKKDDLPGFEGPTAVIFGYEDEIEPIKAVFEFAKTNSIPVFKSGLMADKLLTKDELETLAKLPNKNQLIFKLVGLLASPTYRLVNTLKVNQTKLIYILMAQVNKGGEN